MQGKLLSGAASAVLMIVAVMLMLAPGAWAAGNYKTLYKFSGGTDGNRPEGILSLDAAGNLYGATCSGGAYGNGVVFKLAPNPDGTWTESTLYDFTGGDGSCAVGGMPFDAVGNLYGVTLGGGTYGAGVAYELTPNPSGTWTQTVLYTFTGGTDGDYPNTHLIFDAQGVLYGTFTFAGAYGAGGVYNLTPNSDGTWTQNVLYAFTGGKDGSHPVTFLVFDAAGNLYGSTQWGGKCTYCGVVFELTPNQNGTWTETLLHSFTGGKDGARGSTGLVFDTAGNLYSATLVGGAYSNNGVAYELTPTSGGKWKETVLHQFTGGKDGGGDPGPAWCNLTFDTSGNLYGTRYTDGAYGYGVTYKLTPKPAGGWKETVLRAFNDKPGAYPDGGVIFDAAGNLYGTTSGDGSRTFGTVYEITP